jgi:four helix bundle protein
MSRNHKDLKVWQESMSFVTKIYVISGEFPKSELYGLVNQIRRAAVSIPSNIAEGAARDSAKENIHFLYYSLGSLAEVETQLLISSDLNYIKESTIKELLETIKYIRVMLSGLIKSLAK